MSEHRMQHLEGPTWCKDCGRFDFACKGIECPAPESGAFDTEQEGVMRRILEDFFSTTPEKLVARALGVRP